jgi:hypothetical protein
MGLLVAIVLWISVLSLAAIARYYRGAEERHGVRDDWPTPESACNPGMGSVRSLPKQRA